MAITIKRKKANPQPSGGDNEVIKLAKQRIKELPPAQAKSYLRGLAAAGGDVETTAEIRRMMEKL